MAGEWIKMRTNLWDDPRVSRLCDLTDQGEAAIVGGLYWLWATADEHTEDGFLPGMSMASIDRKVGLQGFAAAMVEIGWMMKAEAGVVIARFWEHNGSSAKRRASEAQRKANSRAVSASDADNLRTDCGQVAELDKRREEKTEEKEKTSAPRASRTPALTTQDLMAEGLTEQTAAEFLDLRKRKKAPLTARAWQGIKKEAGKAGWPVEDAVCKCLARGWTGFEAGWVAREVRPAAPVQSGRFGGPADPTVTVPSKAAEITAEKYLKDDWDAEAKAAAAAAARAARQRGGLVKKGAQQ